MENLYDFIAYYLFAGFLFWSVLSSLFETDANKLLVFILCLIAWPYGLYCAIRDLSK
jgi:hypothetical protein